MIGFLVFGVILFIRDFSIIQRKCYTEFTWRSQYIIRAIWRSKACRRVICIKLSVFDRPDFRQAGSDLQFLTFGTAHYKSDRVLTENW